MFLARQEELMKLKKARLEDMAKKQAIWRAKYVRQQLELEQEQRWNDILRKERIWRRDCEQRWFWAHQVVKESVDMAIMLGHAKVQVRVEGLVDNLIRMVSNSVVAKEIRKFKKAVSRRIRCQSSWRIIWPSGDLWEPGGKIYILETTVWNHFVYLVGA